MGGATRDEGGAAAARRARDVPAKGILGGWAGADPQWFRALATEEGIASLNPHQVRACPSRSSQAPPAARGAVLCRLLGRTRRPLAIQMRGAAVE